MVLVGAQVEGCGRIWVSGSKITIEMCGNGGDGECQDDL